MKKASDNKAPIDPAEVVMAFFDTLNTSGPEAAADYLAENYPTGTHTGDFDLSGMGIGVIPATGKSAITIFSVTHVVEDGKIVSTKVEPVDNMGLENVLAQLGIDLP